MDVMRKILLSTLLLFTFAAVQANAATTVEQLTEPDFVINNGYSEVAISKSRANGEPSEPLYEKKHGRFVRFCRNLYGYIDPAQDTDERIHHNIHMSPSAKDL